MVGIGVKKDLNEKARKNPNILFSFRFRVLCECLKSGLKEFGSLGTDFCDFCAAVVIGVPVAKSRPNVIEAIGAVG